jgi:hypothetical protein
MSRARFGSLGSRNRPLLLYPFLALLSFPTLGQVIFGDQALAYAHDAFDVPRTGVLGDWLAHGPSLWNTHLTAGNALLAQGNGPIAIDVALGFLVGPFAAYAVTAWLLAVVAGISMHLFLRDSLGASTVATIGGAVIYLFGFWHITYSFAAPAVPLLLWLIDGAVRMGPRRWAYALAGSIAGAVALYQGIVPVVLLAAGLQLVWVVLAATDRSDVLRRAGMWVVTWALALGMFAPTILTQVVMLPISQRAIWDLQALYDPTPIVALRDTVRLYASALLGVPFGGGWGDSPAVLGTYFLGIFGVVLVVLGVLARRHDRRTALLVLLLLAIPVVDFVSILIAPLQDQFGFLKSFNLERVRHLYPFALASLAALGLDGLARAITDGRPIVESGSRRRWTGIALAAVALPLLATVVMEGAQLIIRRRQLLDLQVSAMGWALTGLASALGIALLALGAVALRRRGRIASMGSAGTLLAILLVGLMAERAVYAHGERFIDGQLGSWAARLGQTSAQAFLEAQPGIGIERVLTFGDDADRMGARGLLQADGYQAIYPVTYHAFFDGLTTPHLDKDPAMATYFRAWGNRAYAFGPEVDPELVALAGVRWLYVVGPDLPTVPGLDERFRDGATAVFDVPSVLPRAFLADRVAIGATTDDVVEAMAGASLDDVRNTAWLVDGAQARSVRSQVPAGPAPHDQGVATIAEYAPDEVTITVGADRPSVLVLTDVMAPGWVAERDGSPVEIATVDATFRGVVVGPGEHQVVFRYRPLFTYLGFGIGAIALAAAILCALWVRRRDLRSAPDRGAIR